MIYFPKLWSWQQILDWLVERNICLWEFHIGETAFCDHVVWCWIEKEL